MDQITEIGRGEKDKKNVITFGNKTLSKNSLETYRKAVEDYLHYVERTKQVVSPESVKDWLENQRKAYAPATFNLRKQALKAYLLERYKDDYKQLFGIQETFKRVKRQKVEKFKHRHEYLAFDEVMELVEKLTRRTGLIVESLFWTGCRISELIHIKIDDVKTNGKYAIINVKSGKGNKQRTVYLPMDVYEKVKWLFKGKVYLFETESNKQYDRTNLYHEIRRQAKKHGYDISPHTLRHSKAMYLKDVKGMSADMVAKALGHSSVVTTLESYYHGSPSPEDQGIGED